MKTCFSLIIAILTLALGSAGSNTEFSATNVESQSEIARQIIAREKASFTAWQRKDKAFFTDFMAEDATFFDSQTPYLQTDPKENFLPKFEQYVEMFKMNDFQMYNPRVQVYGDVAILTYNSSVSANFGGQQMNYTSKVTSIYHRQGGTWRVVHGHETMNPGTH